MDIEHVKKQLRSEGFPYVYEWQDAPNTEYPSHRHKDKVSFFVVNGSIDFQLQGKVVSLKNGDRFDVPVGEKHTAKTGKEGCCFVVGEMIEGDS